MILLKIPLLFLVLLARVNSTKLLLNGTVLCRSDTPWNYKIDVVNADVLGIFYEKIGKDHDKNLTTISSTYSIEQNLARIPGGIVELLYMVEFCCNDVEKNSFMIEGPKFYLSENSIHDEIVINLNKVTVRRIKR
ncbi:hypothetical protein B9Z55_022666 [Caenorhabditis nigoni]|uniref:Uncharacterized protein n=1 Tax=Caenorhabditis nigoni TaxID=1611254 RepID=A0A2G5SLY5_9PELO|nr:hypothetical protein B9Z55_022666 [Caenorhabditis nigoni]